MRDIPEFLMPFGRRVALFVCLFLLCFIIGSVLTVVIMAVGKGSTISLRIGTVVQDLFIFITPAIATAVMITRRPDSFMQIGKAPGWTLSLLTLAVMVVSVPAMNCVVEWNQAMRFPENMSALEQWMRNAEETAQTTINQLMGGHGVMSCLLGVLIVGVLAGFSEELFFRGALQRLLVTKPVNAHVAIWVTAFIFSAVHFQFFGFVPRMLLGALFGYVGWWTGCLWLPVLAHVFNNSMVVVVTWMANEGMHIMDLNTVGVAGTAFDMIMVVGSVLFTVCGIYAIRKVSHRIG